MFPGGTVQLENCIRLTMMYVNVISVVLWVILVSTGKRTENEGLGMG